jgi:hypothetical protein
VVRERARPVRGEAVRDRRHAVRRRRASLLLQPPRKDCLLAGEKTTHLPSHATEDRW